MGHMRVDLRWPTWTLASVTLAACALDSATRSRNAADHSPEIVTPDGVRGISWTQDEMRQDVAVRTVSRLPQASAHLVRLAGSEKPHFHDRTDLIAFVLEGRVRAHLENRVVEAHAGDVVEIPRGTLHWMENADAQPSLAYVVFTPAFDGNDRRFDEP
jgi:quercetin dioxygenase-like cupin family protein